MRNALVLLFVCSFARAAVPFTPYQALRFDATPDEVEVVRALVKHEMEHVIELSVPIVAEVGAGPNWRDAK